MGNRFLKYLLIPIVAVLFGYGLAIFQMMRAK